MFDLSLPWQVWLVWPYFVTPVWALSGAVLGGILGFWRWRTPGWVVLCVLLGSQVLPWLVMLVVLSSSEEMGAGARAWGLGFVLLLAALAFVLRALSRAQSRRRGGS